MPHIHKFNYLSRMKKTIKTVFSIMAIALVVGVGNSSFAPAKEKLTEQLHQATITTGDCL